MSNGLRDLVKQKGSHKTFFEMVRKNMEACPYFFSIAKGR